jgi:hypothetical protein
MNDQEYQALCKATKEDLRSAREAIHASAFSSQIKRKLLARAEEQYSKRLNEIEKLLDETED